MKFFDLDGPFVKNLNLVADVMVVSVLWTLTSLPIITVGASTTATYYVITRRISDREYKILKDFFISFGKNFVTSTLVFITIAGLLAAVTFNLLFGFDRGSTSIIIYGIYLIIGIQLIFVYIHIFPLVSRFDLKYMQLLKTALIFANKHLITTVTHLALLAAIVMLTLTLPILFLPFAFGFYCWISSFMLRVLYRKYRPELDNDIDPDEAKK